MSASSPCHRPVYTDAQLIQYISHVFQSALNFPTLPRLRQSIATNPLRNLTTLQRLHLSTIPWGSIALHYSRHKTLSLEHDQLFIKVLGRGGYCFEMNTVFATVLRSLGYELYVTAARVSRSVAPGAEGKTGFGGWEHMVILVCLPSSTSPLASSDSGHGQGQDLDKEWYVVDVGFGNFGPVSPVPLLETPDGQEIDGAPGVQCRLVKKPIPDAIRQDQSYWVLEIRNSTDGRGWRDGYAFTELEFLPQDFKNMNFRTSRDPESWFTQMLIVTRYIVERARENDGTGELDGATGPYEVNCLGTVTLSNDALTRRLGANRSETVIVCRSEKERLNVLDERFGVRLNDEEIQGIKGTTMEIKGGQ